MSTKPSGASTLVVGGDNGIASKEKGAQKVSIAQWISDYGKGAEGRQQKPRTGLELII